MRDVVILGVGMTNFGKFRDASVDELGRKACWDAIKDAGIEPKQIQAAYCGHVYQGMVAGQRVVSKLGIAGIPVTNIENACSSGSTALREAWIAVALGFYDVVLAFGMEKLTGLFSGALAPAEEDIEGELGMVFPALYALRGRAYMAEYGATREQVAMVPVKNHRNGSLNPRSQYKNLITVEEVLNSRPIAEPLNLLDCCPIGDGAAAVVITSKEVAQRHTTDMIKIRGCALTSGKMEVGIANFTFEDITARAAREAYNLSGIGPDDIDFLEVHDCFSIAEFLRVEGLGLCKPGEYGRLLESGYWDLDGKIPVNPSGGLLSKGHPLGATGIAQVCELTWQLKGMAGNRQVKDARVGIAHCRGGSVAGTEGGSCTVTIVSR